MANKVELIFGADQVRTTSQVISDLQTIAKKIEASGATRLKFSIDTKGIEDAGGAIQKNVKAFSLTNVATESKRAMSAATAEMTRAKIATQNVKTETEKLVGAKKIEVAATNAAIAKKRLEAVVQKATNNEKKKTVKNIRNETNARLQYNRVLDQSRNYYEKYSSSIRKDAELNKKWQNLIAKLQDPKRYFKSQTKARAEMVSLSRETREAGLQVETLHNKLQRLFGIHLSTALTMVGIHMLIQSLSQVYQNVSDIDTAMTELKKVTDETDYTYSKFLDNAAEKAKKLGSTISDVVIATADFARLGYGLSDASTLAEAATIYKNVGEGISDISTASESIISTMKAFGIEASNSMSIVDKFNEVGNKYAISSEGIGEALKRSASALAVANNTIEESIALAVGMNATLQDPEKVGTILKTSSMYLRAAKTEAEKAGESTEGMANSVSELRAELLKLTDQKLDIMIDDNTFKSSYQIYKELAGIWEKLADVDQANILKLIGGKLCRNVQKCA